MQRPILQRQGQKGYSGQLLPSQAHLGLDPVSRVTEGHGWSDPAPRVGHASQICCPLQPQGWGDGQVLSRELKGGVPFPAPRMMTKHLPHAINAPGNPGQRVGTLEKVPVPTGPS